MGKRNKIRYQSKPKDRPSLTLSGKVYLQYEDDEAMEHPAKGDILFYPYNDALTTTRQGDYTASGFAGYFKLDIYDGFAWHPVLVNDVFPERQHHFSKSECPIDTYNLCAALVKLMAGAIFTRTYREHYTLKENDQSLSHSE